MDMFLRSFRPGSLSTRNKSKRTQVQLEKGFPTECVAALGALYKTNPNQCCQVGNLENRRDFKQEHVSGVLNRVENGLLDLSR